MEQLVSRAAQDFDAFYEQRHHQAAADQAAEGQSAEEPPAEEPRAATDALAAAAVLVITSDAKGVVMHQQDLRPATRKASERTPRSKLNTRLSKGEKRNRKRMATVAAVYAVAAHVRTPEQMLAVLARDEEAEPKSRRGPVRSTSGCGQACSRKPREVLQEAFREASDRDPQGTQNWVAVVDGNVTQLTILEQLAEHYGVQRSRSGHRRAACRSDRRRGSLGTDVADAGAGGDTREADVFALR